VFVWWYKRKHQMEARTRSAGGGRIAIAVDLPQRLDASASPRADIRPCRTAIAVNFAYRRATVPLSIDRSAAFAVATASRACSGAPCAGVIPFRTQSIEIGHPIVVSVAWLRRQQVSLAGFLHDKRRTDAPFRPFPQGEMQGVVRVRARGARLQRKCRRDAWPMAAKCALRMGGSLSANGQMGEKGASPREIARA